jgi:hypothetical protein
MMRTRGVGVTIAAAALLAAAAAMLLTGCATGSTPASGTSSVTVASTPPAPPTQPTTTTPPPTSTAPTTPAQHTTSVPAQPANTCKNLTIRVLPGGAVQQAEIAAVTFVNDSAKACSISGYPSVVLLHKGSTLATATPKTGTVAQAVRLAPGAQAESRITDHSTCDAALSDTIEVTAPNGAVGGKLTRPFQLRGCTVDVAPVRLSE